MKKSIKIIIAVAAAAVLAVILFFVFKPKDKNKVEIDKNTIYKEEVLKLDLPKNFSLNLLKVFGDRLVFSGTSWDDETYARTTVLGSCNLDGSDKKVSTIDLGESGWITTAEVLDENTAVFVKSDVIEDSSDPENYLYEETFTAYVMDFDGKVKKEVSLSDLGVSWLNTFIALDDGILASDGMNYIYFDKDLKVLKQSNSDELSEFYGNVYKLKDNSVVFSKWVEGGQEFYKFDLNTFKLGEKVDYKVSSTTLSVREGSGPYDFLLSDNLQMYGYNIGDDEPKAIVNFLNSNLANSYFQAIAFIDNTSFIGAYNDWTGDYNTTYVSKYTKVDPDTIPDKKNITLGCLWLDGTVRKDVLEFNKTNDEYRIVITDYSVFNTEEDWEAGSKKFNSDIASGQGPDIVISDNAAKLRSYAAKGLFADLNKFLNNDSEINKEDLFENVLNATSYNGKLYAITPSFSISTLVGKTSVLNGKTSWTMDEFLQFKNSLPGETKLFSDMTRETMLSSMLSINVEDYMDSVTAKCHFDSPEFIKLLELIKEFPTEDELYGDHGIAYEEGFYAYEDAQSAYRQNKVALMSYNIWEMSDVKYLVHGTFGEDVTFIGFPCKEGNGSAIMCGTVYGISSKCKHQDVAWDFVRKVITPERQSQIEWGFPTSIKRFDELAAKTKERPYYMDGSEKIEYDDTYYINGQEIIIDPLTDEEVAKVKEFIKSVDRTRGDYSEIIDIINEDAEPFFQGQKTAEDVVKIIQSRASIFLNERQ